MTSVAHHPREILLGAQAASTALPVCDHYSGVEPRMRKSLQLQADMQQEFGHCVFDVTLDCEDGAPVGKEREHAELVAQLANGWRRACTPWTTLRSRRTWPSSREQPGSACATS